jgi:hypothetical protein
LLKTGFFRHVVRRSQYSLAGTSTTEDPRLAENRFLQAGKGAENTKEKSRECFPITVWQLLQFLGILFQNT